MAEKGSRPFGVTLVFVVVLLYGAFAVFAGIMRLFTNPTNTDAPLVAALVTLAIGVLSLPVAPGIGEGRRDQGLLELGERSVEQRLATGILQGNLCPAGQP